MNNSVKLNKAIESLIACGVFVTVLVMVFFQYFKNPETMLPSAGDGMKNYFTYLYHIKYDSTYWKFDGMNYPFGENVVFTDNQPILSNTVKIIKNITPISNDKLIAIHNYFIFLGIILGALGFFYCMRLQGVDLIFSIGLAASVMLLQPQMLRLHSHFSMVFPFLPWIFYLWLKIWRNEKTMKYSAIIALVTFCAGMIHMYHFLTIAAMCGISIFLTFIINKKWRLSFTSFSIQIILPFVFLIIFSNYLYAVPDRPTDPWGFFAYTATWETMFFSYKFPMFHFINDNIAKIRSVSHFEGMNYLGLITVLVLICSGIYFLLKIKNAYSKLSPSYGINSKLLWIFILASLLSFGYPFTITGLDGLLQLAGPYKQFRAIGRLGWISFYSANILALPYLFLRLKKHLNKYIYYILASIATITIFYEGYAKLPDMSNPPQLINSYGDNLLNIPIDKKAYQALIPDPYIHVGSECFGWEDVGGNVDQNLQVGYNLGIPTMGVILSRNSLTQAMLMNELVCQPYRVPDIINLIRKKDNRPLLVMQSKLDLYHNRSRLTHWLTDAPIVFENEKFALRRLELSNFDTISARYNKNLKDTLDELKLPFKFEKNKSQGDWAYESHIMIDSTYYGNALLQFEITCKNHTDVSSTIDTYQFDENHKLVHRSQDRANNFYYKIIGNKMFISLPIKIMRPANKFVVRVSKFNQREKDERNFGAVTLARNKNPN